MLGIIISTIVLCTLMHFMARHEAEYSLPRVLIISALVNVLGMVLMLTLGPLAALLMLAALVYALHQFCYLGWGKALAVTGIYTVAMIAVNMGLQSMLS